VTDVTIAEVADELYGLTPGEFIAARDERARQVRAAGQRDVADAIKKLARPTVSAWLVNQLARTAPDQMTRLYEVGDALAEAQRALAGDRLRELSGERRQAISELIPAAGELAEDLGQPASAAVLGEVRSTLEAVLADAAARSAVQSGRLTKALAYAGLGEVDLTAALAIPLEAASGAAGRGGRAAGTGPAARPAKAGPGQAGAARAAPGKAGSAGTRAGQQVRGSADGTSARDRAAEALRAAQADADEASAALAAADRQAGAVTEQRQFLARRIAHLERELGQAHAEDDKLAREGRQVKRDRDAAARAADSAQRRLDKARQQAARH
jgi:hypothetical protein